MAAIGASVGVVPSRVVVVVVKVDDCVTISVVVLRSASSDVFPKPMPTAGTFPTCFDLVEVVVVAWI